MKKVILFTGVLIVGLAGSSFGQGLVEGLSAVLKEHPDFISARAEHGATEDRRDGKFRDSWLPNVDLSYKYGFQHYNPVDGESSDETPQEFSVRVEQLLTDFGETSSQIAADSSSIRQKQARIEVVQEELLMAGLDGFIRVQKAQKIVVYADLSVGNILKQTQMENMLVEKGRGYSSNVLQAKTQLAGAYARKNQAKAELDVAVAEVDAIFKKSAELLDYNEQLFVSDALLPATLDEAINIALDENPVIKLGAFRSETMKEKIEYEKARAFYPNLSVVGEINRDNDLDGNLGTKRDDRLMLQLSYPINFGLSGLKHSSAAKKELLASEKAEQSVLRNIEKSVRIAWRNYQTAKENIVLLDNKVNIAGEFLRLARKEREVGRRTLLEVLAAETTLVNSQSELASADADLLRSAYSLIYSMGRLNLDFVSRTVDAAGMTQNDVQNKQVYAGMEDIPVMEEAVSEQVKEVLPVVEPPVEAVVMQDEMKQASKDAAVVQAVAVDQEVVKETIVPEEDAEPVLLFNLAVPNRSSSIKLTRAGERDLGIFAEKLKNFPGVSIEINGYISSDINSEENILLSQKRADFVKDRLVEFGVDNSTLVAVGRGNENQIRSNSTAKGRKENRRVELLVFGDRALLEKM